MAVVRNLVARAGIDLSQWEKQLKQMQTSLKKTSKNLEKIGSTLTKTVTLPLVGLVTAATKGMEDFRLDLARLETNAQMAGVSIDGLNEQMRLLAGITGETDSNVEALSNLLAAGFDDNNIADIVNELAGAVIMFPDTLKIESLADSLQETLATGEATGQFAELLERLGYNLEDFEVMLRRATEAGEEHQFILDLLANEGLADYTEAFKENNPELMKSAAATYDFKTALSELGETLTPIVTQITQYTTRLIELYNNLNPEQQKFVVNLGLIAAAAGPALTIIGKITGTIAKMKIATIALTGKIALVVAAIAGIVAILKHAYDTNEEFRNSVNRIFDGLKENFAIVGDFLKDFWAKFGDEIMTVLQEVGLFISNYLLAWFQAFAGIFEFIIGLFSGDLMKAFNGLRMVIDGLLIPTNKLLSYFTDWQITTGTVIDWFKQLPDLFAKIGNKIKTTFVDLPKHLINPVISMLNSLIDGLNKISFDIPSWIPGIGGKSFGIKIDKIPLLADGGIVTAPTLAMIGEGGESEAVIPLSKLGDFANKQPINIYIGNRLLGRYMVDEFGKELYLQSGLRV